MPPPPAKGGLPQDFQDALSIIFDKGVEKANEVVSDTVQVEPVTESTATDATIVETTSIAIAPDGDPMDMDSQSQPEMHIDPNEMTVAPTMELDEQSQYMLYGSMVDKPLVFNDAAVTVASMAKNIPTPPIQILDAAGNLTQIPGPLLEIGNDFMVLDANGQPKSAVATAAAAAAAAAESIAVNANEARKKRLHELDDLAMLGIDAEDVCI